MPPLWVGEYYPRPRAYSTPEQRVNAGELRPRTTPCIARGVGLRQARGTVAWELHGLAGRRCSARARAMPPAHGSHAQTPLVRVGAGAHSRCMTENILALAFALGVFAGALALGEIARVAWEKWRADRGRKAREF